MPKARVLLHFRKFSTVWANLQLSHDDCPSSREAPRRK